MSKILAYFVGGSHDLEKRWIDGDRPVWELPMYMDAPYPVTVTAEYVTEDAVFKIERYVKIARLHTERNAYVYEYRPNE